MNRRKVTQAAGSRPPGTGVPGVGNRSTSRREQEYRSSGTAFPAAGDGKSGDLHEDNRVVMKLNDRIRRGLMAACMLAGAAAAQAQVLTRDTVKVVYPGDSAVVEVPGSQDRYMEEKSVLPPGDEGKLTAVLRKDGLGAAGKTGRDWAKWRPSPKRALWLALVLPGAGQVYNRKYWKLPIFYGGFVGCIYAMTWNNQMYHDYAQAYIDIMDNDPATQSYNSFLHLGTTITPANEERYKSIFKQRKDRYRRWRDLSVFTTIAVYALSVIDAYVDASLSDFDISDDLSLHIAPAVIPDRGIVTPGGAFRSPAIGVGCSLTF